MKIQFEKEGSVWYAISYYEVYEGYMHDELWHAEISEVFKEPDSLEYVVRFEGDWNDIKKFNSLDEAKEYVINNWDKRVPYSNGLKYKLDAE